MGVLVSFAAALSIISIIMTHHVTHMSAYGTVSQRCVPLCLYLLCVLNREFPLSHPSRFGRYRCDPLVLTSLCSSLVTNVREVP